MNYSVFKATEDKGTVLWKTREDKGRQGDGSIVLTPEAILRMREPFGDVHFLVSF